MIIALLVLIVLAILFPGFVRFVLCLLCLFVVLAAGTDNGKMHDVQAQTASGVQTREEDEADLRAFASSKGETVEAFASRVGSTHDHILAFIHASEAGGSSSVQALRSLESFGTRLREEDGPPLPVLDPDAYCDRRSAAIPKRFDDPQGLTFRHTCIDSEQEGYENLKEAWPRATDEERDTATAFMKKESKDRWSYAGLFAYLNAIVERDALFHRNEEMKSVNHFHAD
ncbi:hypothetical protein [Beijerinckia sp. L45]|uniref:hypothetical protein n=1 Tax=Beijerinckia sp. L45 TaxID=1641855 RepID=UPI00131AC1D2|nr:hypothetical protein [Beijerinckia sp. L45]